MQGFGIHPIMPPKAKMNRRAKQTKSPELTTGSGQEAKGPFQDQEISLPTDQLESSNSRALKPCNSSEDSESDVVDMGNDSDSDIETIPRGKTRMAVEKIIKEAQLVLTPV